LALPTGRVIVYSTQHALKELSAFDQFINLAFA
jgi:hypothetical protein